MADHLIDPPLRMPIRGAFEQFVELELFVDGGQRWMRLSLPYGQTVTTSLSFSAAQDLSAAAQELVLRIGPPEQG